jgi:hypothetical protein
VPHGVAVVEVGTSFSDELARAGVGELAGALFCPEVAPQPANSRAEAAIRA